MPPLRQTFHEELNLLEQRVLHMGTVTGAMVADAVEAFTRGNTDLAEDVIARDDDVDALDLDIEDQCMRLLALQQPMARDLRQIGTAMKVITDLERVGDHAVDIAKIARKLTRQLFVSKPLVDVGALAEMTRRMLRQSLESLVRHDVALADQVCRDDDAADDEFKSLREQLLDLTQNDTRLIAPASYTLLAAVDLERIADHATNIAERVVYIETGRLERLGRSRRRLEASAA